MKILLATSTALAVIGLAGCGGESGKADSTPTNFLDNQKPTAVVTGRLLNVDGDGKHPKPTAGTVILTGKNGAEVTDEVSAAGTFEIRVLPGDYKVTGKSPQPDGGVALCAAKAPTTTVSGEATTVVDVLCFIL